jgi:hypothetical protein
MPLEIDQIERTRHPATAPQNCTFHAAERKYPGPKV